MLDGVARGPNVEECRTVANQEGARFLLVLTECADLDTHRSRVASRQRLIPCWYELDWEQVERSRSAWDRPQQADLVLQAIDSVAGNRKRLSLLIDGG